MDKIYQKINWEKIDGAIEHYLKKTLFKEIEYNQIYTSEKFFNKGEIMIVIDK
jgi:hypothetical protein